MACSHFPSAKRLCDTHHSDMRRSSSYVSAQIGGGMVRPAQRLESTMKTREMTNEVLNDETLESVAGSFWVDGGCIPDILGTWLHEVLHPTKPGGPINTK